MNYDQIMELDNVTVQDCIDMYNMKGMVTICNDGKSSRIRKGERTRMVKHAKFSKVSYEQFKSAITTCVLNSNVTYNFETTDKFIQSLYDNIKLPKRATSGSAGYDFYAPVSIKLNPGEDIVIPTGIRCEMNENLALLIYPRSGLGFNYIRLANSTGIIDSDYAFSDNEGHIMIKIRNESKDKTLIIEEGKGCAQGVFSAYYRTDDDEVTKTRNGGFGSTTK